MKGGVIMEQVTLNRINDIKLSIGSFIIVAGLFTVMFHVILFPILGVLVGIPWVVGAVAHAAANREHKAERVCAPGMRLQDCR